jgi:hypothetical protein
MTAMATETITIDVAEFAEEAELFTGLRNEAWDRGEYDAYRLALSMIHRLSRGVAGARLDDQPVWQEKD